MEGGSGDGTAAHSLYAALGLSPEDVETLAQIPENEISVETLPYLIMQLKAKRAEKGAASTDTDHRDKTPTAPKEPEADQPKRAEPETPEKGKEKRGSPPSSSLSRRSEGHSSNHDHEHHGKGDGYRRTERPGPAGRRDSRHRKSSRERQTGDSSALEMELDDNPTVFPHVCSICKIKVSEAKAWSGHLRGVRHMEARREYMRFSYSEDDSHSSRRSSRSSLPSKRSYSFERSTGDLPSPSDRHFPPYMPFTRVVVAKFPMGCVAVADMLALGKPFGTIVKHLIFPFKGFLEFSSHGEAKNMVSHYHTKPAFIKGHRISLCLSPTVEVIHPPEVYEPGAKRMKPSSPSVVCLSRLPVGKETEEEVLDIAAMFGDVRQSKFTEDRALIEMVDWRDADIMVKYYHSNPLRIQDKSIKVSLSSLSSLRDGSPDHSSSKKSDASKSHSSSSSRQKNESTSSKSTYQSSSKDKSKSSSKEPSAAEPQQEKEKEGEDGEKEKEEKVVENENEVKEAEKEEKETEKEEKETEKEEKEAEKEEKEAEKEMKESEEVEKTEEELKDESDPVDAEAADGVDVPMEEEEQKEREEGGGGGEGEGEGEGADSKEEKQGEDERVPAEKEENKGDKASEEDMEDAQDDLEDMDFPENMDDFVTLDELDTLETSEPLEGKVVVVRPIRKEFREARKKAVRKALHKMAAPFGNVVNFVISFYRHEALIELETVENAHEMVNFYKNSKKSELIGRPVTVSISPAFNTIEGPSGRSLFIKMLPSFKYSIMSLLRLAQPFGKITAYCSNRMYRTCYVQMETKEATEKMYHKYSRRPPTFYGSVLKITMCRKGDSLIPWTPVDKFERGCDTMGIRSPRDGEERGQNGQSSRNYAGEDRHSPVSNYEGVGGDPVREGGDSDEEEKSQSPLGPYQPDNPVGVDYVVARSGFFCKLCNMFYTDEKRAKSEHCRSLEHYKMLKRKRGEEVEEEQTEEPTPVE
ncbi:uncharacterized protein [Salminus brasiliensis]|uniref:uncharacterized protein n=1 Tax=Salminus brasiliensis TaxID=930266 RepID=UPI003B82C833